jgi:hypothetical protein
MLIGRQLKIDAERRWKRSAERRFRAITDVSGGSYGRTHNVQLCVAGFSVGLISFSDWMAAWALCHTPAMDLTNVILTGCLTLITLLSVFVAFCAMRGANKDAMKQLTASMAPIVADVSQDLLESARTDRLHSVVVEQDGDAYAITLPCRNVGPGPAVIEDAAIFLTEYDASTRAEVAEPIDGAPAELSLGVIPPSETALIKASLQLKNPVEATIAKALGLAFYAIVKYTDVAGGQRRMSTIYVVPRSHLDGYIETAVRVRECDSNWEPIRPIVQAHRTLRVPTASDRLSTLIEDTTARITNISEGRKEYWDKIEKRMAARNEHLEAAERRIDPQILKFSRQQREIHKAATGADGASAHGITVNSGDANDSPSQ